MSHQAQFKEKLLDDYLIVRKLGEGGYGKVKLAKDRNTGELFAVKIIDHSKHNMTEVVSKLKTLQNENEVLKTIVHPNIVRFFKLVEKGMYRVSNKNPRTVSYAVMEYCSKGEFYDVLVGTQGLSDNAARFYFAQLVRGEAFLETLKIAHRDMKPENLLLTEDLQLKIIDFGFSTHINPNQLNDTHLGSDGYMAPEFLKTPLKYNASKVDIWACGVVLFNMMTGLPPFQSKNFTCQLAIRFKANDNSYWEFFEKRCNRKLSAEFRQLLRGMMDFNPDTRLSFQQILETPWMKQAVDEALALQEVSKRISANMVPAVVNPAAVAEAETHGVAKRSGEALTKCFENLLVERDEEKPSSCLLLKTPDIDATMSHLVQQIPEGKLKFHCDEKKRLFVSNGQTHARVLLSCGKEEGLFGLRVIMRQGDYSLLQEMKQEIYEKIRSLT